MITIQIRTDGDSMEDGGLYFETPRLLRVLASKFEKGITEGSILDLNGNKIGCFTTTDCPSSPGGPLTADTENDDGDPS